jgi:hypothetical protein
MITLQVIYADSAVPVKMATEYSELSWHEFTLIEDNARNVSDNWHRLIKNIAILCRLPEEDIELWPEDAIHACRPFVKFLDSLPTHASKVPDDVLAITDLGELPWKYLELAKMHIQTGMAGEKVNHARAMAGVVAVYTDYNLDEMKLLDAIPIALHFKSLVETFFEQYKRLTESEQTPEQLEAGIDRFKQFGYFTTLHALCNGNPLKYEDMLNQKAHVIYQTLVFDLEQSKYNERLAEIKSKKTK